mmetsp:Transcript_6266/g.15883  ORF Transcript_6266/g.15883 Transcript_6266/m.15883 type:complete len:134 (-) Transcript_6266:92-493(-)|eukprot:CAMPEP_0177657638 /NCGR_PEP_ID=MMETSP0447-20121125/16312_1 /TAXON_ID=0 /ORGANISM="Stygamoeba regulata, Strain BSH-02190019" /LENGTH=133 /DNA_ID=CAMNT_0019162047 /DNA_START=16 /DNA_END=417 /DNA_ORIENTATION=-
MPQFGGGVKCPRCKKTVYAAEKKIGPGGDWHARCLVCPDCNKSLDSTTLAEHQGEAYCRACHASRFGPKGLRQGTTMHTEPISAVSSSSASPASAPARASAPAVSSSGPKFCSGCGNKLIAGAKFCPDCGNRV